MAEINQACRCAVRCSSRWSSAWCSHSIRPRELQSWSD